MSSGNATLTKKNLINARKILFTVTGLLDSHNIPYHLEGGTLLGIVRDKDLLPWDHDVDISIPARYAADFVKLKAALLFKGYRMSIRKSKINAGPVKEGEYSVFKIKPVWSYVLSWVLPNNGMIVLDVFAKTNDDQHTYWQAKNKIMRVDKKFYTSFETVTYMSHVLKVPNHFQDYLTQKYGDWSVPVKEWSCDTDERTVIQ